MLNMGIGELGLLLALFILIFGAKKLPELAKSLGESIRAFQKAKENPTLEKKEGDKKDV